eukprot:scaffold20550_cov232-Skeletonema_marinoi.AAC.1
MSTCSGAASPFSYESTRNGNGVMCSSTVLSGLGKGKGRRDLQTFFNSKTKDKYLLTFSATYKYCRNDGDHPDYMEINPTEWLSSSLDACCKKFFGGFLYKQCIGAYPPDADDCNLMLFYPDWNGAS